MRNLLLLYLVATTYLPALATPPIAESYSAPPGVSVSEPTAATSLPLSIELKPITFMAADAAEVIAADEGVIIFAEGLKAGTRYGMVLTVADQPVEFVEVHPKANPFPPTVKTPFRPNAFLIEGKLGEVFYVSVRAANEAPTWVTVVIVTEDGPPPVEPPPSDGAIEKLSRARADALNDPPTRAALKTALDRTVADIGLLCAQGNCPDVAKAQVYVVAAIESVMGARRGPSEFVEWKAAWRTPISDAIQSKAVTTTAGYLALMKEAAQGL